MRNRRWQTYLGPVFWVFTQVGAAAAQQDTSGPNRPMVIRGTVVYRLPIDDVRQLLTLRAGSFLMPGGRAALRGFAGGEAVYVDQVPVTNQLFGTTFLTPPIGSVERVAVTTSGAPASFGNAQSGLLAIDSHPGSGNWHGGLRLATDEFSPWSIGTSRLDLNGRGGIGSRFGLSFGLSAQGNRSTELVSAFNEIPLYAPAGPDTVVRLTVSNGTREVIVPDFALISQSGMLPRSANDQYRAQLRADLTPAAGSDVFVSVLAARDQSRTAFGGTCASACNAFLPGAQDGTFERSTAIIFGVQQRLMTIAGGDLGLLVRVAQLRYRKQSGPLDPDFAGQQQNPELGFTTDDFAFVVDPDVFDVDRVRVENFLRNQGERTPFEITRTDITPSTEFRFNPYGVISGFLTRGFSGRHEFGKESASYARAAIQFETEGHQAEVGGELQAAEVAYIDVGLNSLAFADMFVEKPRRGSLYVRDLLRWGPIKGDFGVRFDRFDPNTRFPVTPGYHNLDDPRTSFDAEPESAVSPSVALAADVNSRMRVLFAWIRTAELPSAAAYYSGKNTDFFRFRNTNLGEAFARPIGLERTTTLELAVERDLSRTSFVQLTGFSQRHDQERVFRLMTFEDPTNRGVITHLRVPVLRNGREYRGVILRLASRDWSELSWDVAYAYESAGEIPSDPGTIVFAAEHKRHTFNGFFAGSLGDLLQWRGASGLHLSATARVTSEHVFLDPLSFDFENPAESSSGPLGEIDLRLSQQVRFAGIAARAFIDGRNLLDRHPSFDGDAVDRQLERVVAQERVTLGGGEVLDRVDLVSLSSAQQRANVRNEADLAALRQAERRFGNGDLLFTADEQIRAFTAGHRLRLAASLPTGTQRRVRFGFELQF